MSAVRLYTTAASPTRFAVDEVLSWRGRLECCVGGDNDVAHCGVNVRTASARGQRAIGSEIGAAPGQLDAVLEAAIAYGSETSALNGVDRFRNKRGCNCTEDDSNEPQAGSLRRLT